ncbi:MAG TPA: hypothetical protein VFV72_01675 [Candidatus Limnocylindrales bacterium]|nr:hypothetical protein [Candidatus Limnocylindrales bacterium]
MSTWTGPPAGFDDVGPMRRHRIALPFALGFASGITGGGVLLGGVVLGYVVGRSGLGAAGAAVGAIGSILGSTILFAWLVWGMVSSGCPSCIDAVIFGWMVPLFYAVPFLIGCGIGSWRYGRVRR